MENLIELMKKLKRLPQIITPKDASLILAYSGIPPNAKIVDAGSGSGFLSIFLGWYCPQGQVFTYEKREEFSKVVERNIEKIGLKNITVKNKNILDGIEEKEVDLVTLDMKDCEKVIPLAYESLKEGGWVVVYSPYVEQVIDVLEEMKTVGFKNCNCVESIVREWKSNYGFTRPKSQGLMHTGWISFGRKVNSKQPA